MALLGWAILFLILAIVAAIFGFALLASAAAWIAKALFIVFLIVFLITLIRHFTRSRV